MAKNIGAIYTNYVNCFVDIPVSILNTSEYKYLEVSERNSIQYKSIYCDNTITEVKEIELKNGYPITHYWPSKYDPILPQRSLRLEDIKLAGDLNLQSRVISWQLHADNAPMEIGEMKISERLLKLFSEWLLSLGTLKLTK